MREIYKVCNNRGYSDFVVADRVVNEGRWIYFERHDGERNTVPQTVTVAMYSAYNVISISAVDENGKDKYNER